MSEFFDALEKAKHTSEIIGSNILPERPSDILQKGKAANIGEIREWSGKKYKKQANGKWVEVSEQGKTKSESEELKNYVSLLLEETSDKNSWSPGFENQALLTSIFLKPSIDRSKIIVTRNNLRIVSPKKSELSSKFLKYNIEVDNTPGMTKKQVDEWNKQDRHLQMQRSGGKDNRSKFTSFGEFFEKSKDNKIESILIFNDHIMKGRTKAVTVKIFYKDFGVEEGFQDKDLILEIPYSYLK